MQNKKSLLQRLLVIYITFFIVLVASIAHGVLPNFSRGAAEGMELGHDIAEKWKSGVPRMIYMLGDIRITGQPENVVQVAATTGSEISASVRQLELIVEQDAPEASPLGLAFVSKVAPPHMQGLMQGFWLAATAVGNALLFVGGWLYLHTPMWATWFVFVAACGLSMLVMLSMVRWLERVTR